MERPTRNVEVVKLESPTGHYCYSCMHFVKDPTPGMNRGKCVRYPPVPMMFETRSGGVVNAAVSVMVGQPDQEWCGEWQQAKHPLMQSN